jgi:hypothetical protein
VYLEDKIKIVFKASEAEEVEQKPKKKRKKKRDWFDPFTDGD